MIINISKNGYQEFLTYKFMDARIEEEFSNEWRFGNLEIN